MAFLTLLSILISVVTRLQAISIIHGEYRVFLEKTIVSECDEEYMYANVSNFKYNRTNIAFNFTVVVNKEIPTNVKANAATYEFLDNEYRPFVINVTRDLCQSLNMEYKMFYPDFNKEGNNPIPAKCPIQPGIYIVSNYVPNDKNFPIQIPFHKMMLEVKFLLGKRTLMRLQLYATIDRDIIFRENYG